VVVVVVRGLPGGGVLEITISSSSTGGSMIDNTTLSSCW